MKLVRLTALVAAATLAVAGCGDDGDEASEPPLDQVSSYLPADASVVSFVDLAGVRGDLGLPADADALDFDALQGADTTDSSPEAQLVEAAIIGMPSLTSFVQTFEADPESAEFDGTAITAAANTLTDDGPLTVILTSQPFDELVDGLTALGYTVEGDTLTKPGARFEQVSDGGDGIVVIGRNEGPADAVADPPGGPAALVSLIEPADEPIAQAANGIADCVERLGGWENAQMTAGVLRFVLDQPASADKFDIEQLEEELGLTAETPTVDGETANIAFTADADPPGSRLRALLTRFVTGYDCG